MKEKDNPDLGFVNFGVSYITNIADWIAQTILNSEDET